MTRPNWNYLVDVVMFSMMGAMIFIGVLMAFFLASGPVVDEGSKYVWGLHRHQWGDIHMILSFIFTGLFLIHILLHWGWIKGATKKLLRSPATLILILLLPVLVILVAWSVSEKDSPVYGGGGVQEGSAQEGGDQRSHVSFRRREGHRYKGREDRRGTRPAPGRPARPEPGPLEACL
jgi:hypothetical protein